MVSSWPETYALKIQLAQILINFSNDYIFCVLKYYLLICFRMIPIGHISKFQIDLSFHTHLGRQKSTRFIRLLDLVNGIFIHRVKFSGNKLCSKTENYKNFYVLVINSLFTVKNKSSKAWSKCKHIKYLFSFHQGTGLCSYGHKPSY